MTLALAPEYYSQHLSSSSHCTRGREASTLSCRGPTSQARGTEGRAILLLFPQSPIRSQVGPLKVCMLRGEGMQAQAVCYAPAFPLRRQTRLAALKVTALLLQRH